MTKEKETVYVSEYNFSSEALEEHSAEHGKRDDVFSNLALM